MALTKIKKAFGFGVEGKSLSLTDSRSVPLVWGNANHFRCVGWPQQRHARSRRELRGVADLGDHWCAAGQTV